VFWPVQNIALTSFGPLVKDRGCEPQFSYSDSFFSNFTIFLQLLFFATTSLLSPLACPLSRSHFRPCVCEYQIEKEPYEVPNEVLRQSPSSLKRRIDFTSAPLWWDLVHHIPGLHLPYSRYTLLRDLISASVSLIAPVTSSLIQ
jgi:hypothetical protein